jgi:hypothetical protein
MIELVIILMSGEDSYHRQANGVYGSVVVFGRREIEGFIETVFRIYDLLALYLQ